MSVPSHTLRRLALIALLACAVLSGLSSPASARPIIDRTVTTSTAAPSTSAARESHDWTLPIVLAGAVALVVVGTVGYSHRARASHRVTA